MKFFLALLLLGLGIYLAADAQNPAAPSLMVNNCGTGATCATSVLPMHEVVGTVTMSGGAGAVSGLPFSTNSSFWCVAADQSATAGARIRNTGVGQITINTTNTADVVTYRCIGY